MMGNNDRPEMVPVPMLSREGPAVTHRHEWMRVGGTRVCVKCPARERFPWESPWLPARWADAGAGARRA